MQVVLRQAWQQKHPSPSHPGWDFHWHPVELAGARQAIAAAAVAARADEAVAVWSIGPRHALWLRSFAAVAPAEQRRYVGWTGCAAEPADGDALPESAWAQALPSVWADMVLPPARPFAPGDGAAQERRAVSPAPALLDPGPTPILAEGEAIARALYAGGPAMVADPHDPTLPALWGRLLSWLPPRERVRARAGMLAAHVASAPLSESARNLCHYLHRSWQHGGRRPWRLVLDLCASEHIDLAELFEQLTQLAVAWERAADLEAYLVGSGTLGSEELAAASACAPAPLRVAQIADAGRLWNRLLHYWGRGFLGAQARGELAQRLAAVLARRITVDHLMAQDMPGRADPERYLRRLRFEALLTERDLRALRAALSRLLPSLEVQRERA